MNSDHVEEGRRHLATAMRHHGDGRLAEAQHHYRAALAAGYRTLDIHRLLGGISLETGNFPQAEAHWRAVLRAVPDDVATLVALAATSYQDGRPADAADWLSAVAARQPDHPFVIANLGTILLDAGRRDQAVAALRHATRLRPGDPLLAHRLRRATAATVPYWHVPMMNDAPRNQAFRAAIERAVHRHGETARVLEIGTGAGLLALMAARAGAAAVDTCEAVAVIAEAARAVIAANGLSNRVSVIGKHSRGVAVGRDVAAPADILVAEILSSDILTEGVLPTFEDAATRLARPGATIIPAAVTAVGCLVGGAGIERMLHVDKAAGFDVTAFAPLAPQRIPLTTAASSWRRLSADHDLIRLDLTAASHPPVWHDIAIPVTGDGTVCGLLQWMCVDLDGETSFSTHPHSYRGAGWTQIVHTLDHPFAVRAGQVVHLRVGHDRTSLLIQRTPAAAPSSHTG